jgi:hypothetical protein
MTLRSTELLEELDACPLGIEGWRVYEDVATKIVTFLFVPPLSGPTPQARSFSGIDRRDLVFGNRNMTPDTTWGQLRIELDARMPLFEFKNYESEVGTDEVDQTRNYLTGTIGRLAVICCRKPPSRHARLRRNQVYTQDRKVILFMTDEDLKEMLRMKERNADPALFLMDLLELFYIQHE